MNKNNYTDTLENNIDIIRDSGINAAVAISTIFITFLANKLEDYIKEQLTKQV